jgi:hypothetical protein
LSTGTGLGLSDGGAQSDLEIILNGASGSLEVAGNGVIVKTGSTSVTARVITTAGAGLTISNGNGVSGNPTIALSGLAASLANMGGTGILGVVGGASITSMVITGTTNQIDVANGAGPGNPTLSISTNPVLPGTGAVTIPKGTTAQRPGGVDGMIRFNTDISAYETYDTTGGWSTLPSGAVTQINTGTGLTGGPITSSGTISIANTGVVAGVYGSQGSVGSITLNAQGQATSATNVVIEIDASQVVAGTILIDRGGTGLNSYSVGDVVYYDGTTSFAKLSVVPGYLIGGGSSVPEYIDPSTLSVASAATAGVATNIAGGAAGSIPYQTGSGTTVFLAQASGVLVGGTTPSYSTAPSLTGTNFTAISNAALDNSAITIGTTSISLGSSSLTLGGLTSVAVTQDPSNALDLATKQYVDVLVTSGIHFHEPVRVESPIALTATYNNGTSGVGATLTNSGAQAALVIDGVTLSLNDRVLIYTQTDPVQNGIYVVSNVGSVSTNWVLTRATDADSYGLASPDTLGEGSSVFVQQGDTGAGELYLCNTVGTIVFGTTPITFVQISSAQIYSAGTGLTLTGTQFSVTTNGITDALFRQSAGLSVVGRSANSTGNVADIVAASDYQVLRRSGTSIGFGAVALDQSGAITGTLATGNGGTGLASYTAGDIVYYATGTALSKLAIGSSTYLLTSSGTAPQWSDPSGVTVGIATNVSGGGAGQLVYNTGSSTTTFLALGTSGHILTAGASAPQYTDPATVTVGNATNADNVAVSASSTNATFYPTFVDATSGDQAIEVDSDLTYNPSTNTLTVPNLVATSGISGGTF